MNTQVLQAIDKIAKDSRTDETTLSYAATVPRDDPDGKIIYTFVQ
jgi:quinol monooxygenase YgiN